MFNINRENLIENFDFKNQNFDFFWANKIQNFHLKIQNFDKNWTYLLLLMPYLSLSSTNKQQQLQ